MNLITIDTDTCNRDGLCVRACPVGLIEMEAGGAVPAAIAGAAKACIRCGHCVAVCPTSALTNNLMPLEEFHPVPANRPGPDEVEALLLGRRSVREFRKAPVSREQLERLLEVTRRAPTASNSQNVSWIMIQDCARLEEIRELTVQWMGRDPRRARHVQLAERGRDVVLRGGTVLAVAHAPEKYVWNDVDCAIALTYMELHAASLGLGVCWGGLVTAASWAEPALARVLGLPEGQRAGGALMLGLPRQKHYLVPPRNAARVTWL
ncbi:nitroreductase family protein [Desulfocurvus sp. DL9XJH121]